MGVIVIVIVPRVSAELSEVLHITTHMIMWCSVLSVFDSNWIELNWNIVLFHLHMALHCIYCVYVRIV